MNRTRWSIVITLVVLAAFLLLWQFRYVAWLFLISIITAATFRPYIQFFSRRGLSGKLAVTLGYSVALLGLVIFLGVWLYLVSQELPLFVNELTKGYEILYRSWPDGTSFQKAVAERLPPTETIYTTIFGEDVSTLTRLTGLTSLLTQNIGYLVIVLALSIYWTGDQAQFERLWLSFIPVAQRARAREIWREVEMTVGAYTSSEILQSILAAVLLGFGYWLMGLGYPVLLATVSAAFWLVPLLGFVPGLLVVAISALFYNSGMLWVAVIFTLFVFLLLEWFVEPRLFNRSNFSTLLLLAVLVVFIERLGIFGVLIAPPVAVAIQILGRRLMRDKLANTAPDEVITLTSIKQDLDSVAVLMTQPEMVSLASPKTLGLLTRLKDLVAATEQTIELPEPQDMPTA